MVTWSEIVDMAARLPEVEESTWYRTPGLTVRGRGFARLRTESDGGLVLLCAPDEKEALLASGDPAYYTTPHYTGHAIILVDLDHVDPDQLRELLTEAWRRRAPARLRRTLPEP
ncbi:MmcQ/YjbR family DNA-binding protein [Lipingzhangella sp. LS1_29]|uniref:MmcQ/YjbR family DNA-binding protein n=1 Tax=Lipingzhangella rawalii TaxID=2055835 RepID=A0ABU2HAI7_9ACTN|nr:MmcQ/YjbR family DNA-binding protein [Lipingzhangella rawalii]MDS1271850.1 MmcQ/YjbR family DNA-binding protein [Lipingzhangella rawalii]